MLNYLFCDDKSSVILQMDDARSKSCPNCCDVTNVRLSPLCVLSLLNFYYAGCIVKELNLLVFVNIFRLTFLLLKYRVTHWIYQEVSMPVALGYKVMKCKTRTRNNSEKVCTSKSPFFTENQLQMYAI